VWHRAPAWFVKDTPVGGYTVPAQGGVVLLFWNGQAFGDPGLTPMGKFEAAQIEYYDVSAIAPEPLRRWLKRVGTELCDVRPLRRRMARAGKR